MLVVGSFLNLFTLHRAINQIRYQKVAVDSDFGWTSIELLAEHFAKASFLWHIRPFRVHKCQLFFGLTMLLRGQV